ncbi:MAG: class II aldolase/adducin family protein [Synergistaceae bacterium]|nr:class II aldolase/adducin family protein [Synergistaceae bacterium]
MTKFSQIETAKHQMLEICRKMDSRGYLADNDACVTYRLPDGGFLALATGVYRWRLDEEAVIELDSSGDMLESAGFLRPSSDVAMHLEIYRAHRSMQAVINAQPPYATLCAVSGVALDSALTPAAVTHLGVVPLVHFEIPGSRELCEVVAKSCPGHFALLLGNRGALVWGDNLFEAYQRMETLEGQARLTIGARGTEARILPKAAVRELVARRLQYGVNLGGIPGGQ